jgi:hypothetical protein
MAETPDPGAIALHRRFGAEFFNAVWTLLEDPQRSAEAGERMLHLAHASLAHWLIAGGRREASVGCWQIARVLCALGRPAEALPLARRAVALAQDLGPFWRASAQEGLARALRPLDPVAAAAAEAAARALLPEIAGTADRALVLSDLATGAA